MAVLTLNNQVITLNNSALSLGGGVPYKTVYFSNIASTCPNEDEIIECTCGCLSVSSAMNSGDCFCPAFSWYLGKDSTANVTTACVEVICNSSTKYSCIISAKGCLNCSGTFTPFCVDYNDTVHIITYAETEVGTEYGAYSQIVISNIVSGVGNYCVGNPYYQASITCSMLA